MTPSNDPNVETDYGKLLLALLAGAGAGLAAGILFAPKSGDRLRAEIRSRVNVYLAGARHKAGELKTFVTDVAQRGVTQVQRTKDNAVGKFRDMKVAVAGAVDTGALEINSAIDHTVAAVNTGAKKGHDLINGAADSVRTATRA